MPGFEGVYSISDAGVVLSHAREVRHYRGGTSSRRARTLAQRVNRWGYPQVNLYRDCKSRTFKVATLVLLAFKGPAPVGMEACHNDGVRTNSLRSNLRWGTRQSNVDDKQLHGTSPEGERNGRSHIKADDARAIRVDRRTGDVIGAQYGITRAMVNRIRRGDAWRSA